MSGMKKAKNNVAGSRRMCRVSFRAMDMVRCQEKGVCMAFVPGERRGVRPPVLKLNRRAYAAPLAQTSCGR